MLFNVFLKNVNKMQISQKKKSDDMIKLEYLNTKKLI